MDTNVILKALGITTVIACIFLYRNEWVYEKRMKALDIGIKEYNLLFSYNEMMILWWIWEIEKLKKHSQEYI